MNKVFWNFVVYCVSTIFVTIIIGALVFLVFGAALGVVFFVAWSFPVIDAAIILLFIRASLVFGLICGIAFSSSREGIEFRKEFLEDWKIENDR
jgi:uncharacterized protein YneF (UPF0154 family)